MSNDEFIGLINDLKLRKLHVIYSYDFGFIAIKFSDMRRIIIRKDIDL